MKVTLARKGLLRVNERMFAPIVFLTRQHDLSFLPEVRRRAIFQALPIPGPTDSPDAWQGKAADRTFKKGLFTTKKIGYKVALLLPVPLIYASKSQCLP